MSECRFFTRPGRGTGGRARARARVKNGRGGERALSSPCPPEADTPAHAAQAQALAVARPDPGVRRGGVGEGACGRGERAGASIGQRGEKRERRGKRALPSPDRSPRRVPLRRTPAHAAVEKEANSPLGAVRGCPTRAQASPFLHSPGPCLRFPALLLFTRRARGVSCVCACVTGAQVRVSAPAVRGGGRRVAERGRAGSGGHCFCSLRVFRSESRQRRRERPVSTFSLLQRRSARAGLSGLSRAIAPPLLARSLPPPLPPAAHKHKSVKKGTCRRAPD